MNLIKVIATALLISISLNISYGQRQSGRKSFNLIGKVAVLHEYTYSAQEKFGEVTKGQLKEEVTYKFNEKGDLIEKQFTDRNWGSKIIRTYQYNEKGQLVEANDSGSRIIYKSDPKGNPIEEAVYNRDGDLKSKTYYKYDANNREIEVRTNQSGTETKTTYKYDLKGNKIQEILFMGDSQLGTVTTKYDLKGNPIEDIVDSHVKLRQEYKYTYDGTGNFITKTLFSSSSFSGIKYELAVKEIVERNIEYELSVEDKEKLRIEEEKRIQIEEQRKNEEIEKERLKVEQEKMRQEEMVREKERKERNELLSFLKQRKTKYYDLDSLSKADFSNIKSDIQRTLYEKIKTLDFDELTIGGVLIVTSDTVDVVTVNTTKLTSNKSEVLKTILTPPLSLKLPSQKIKSYKVNTRVSVPIDVKCTKVIVNFKLKKSNEIVYSKNEPNDRIKQLIRKTYQIDSKAQNIGSYTVEYLTGYINDREYEEVRTVKYKLGAGGLLDYLEN